jgi:hypothetical protein
MCGAAEDVERIRDKRIWVEKTKRKRRIVRHRSRWKGNIQTFLKSLGLEEVNWIRLAEWWTVVNTAMNFRVK